MVVVSPINEFEANIQMQRFSSFVTTLAPSKHSLVQLNHCDYSILKFAEFYAHFVFSLSSPFPQLAIRQLCVLYTLAVYIRLLNILAVEFALLSSIAYFEESDSVDPNVATHFYRDYFRWTYFRAT